MANIKVTILWHTSRKYTDFFTNLKMLVSTGPTCHLSASEPLDIMEKASAEQGTLETDT